MKKPFRFLLYPLTLILISLTAGCGLIRSLGKKPDGEALKKLQSLPNYKNGRFQNLYSSDDTAKINVKQALKAQFSRPETIKPSQELPWIQTNLKSMSATRPIVIWFGHSSLFIKTKQATVLIDPVFSNHAGPIPGLIKAFKGTTHYKASDMPLIDILIISHDHYDHLDYRTVKALRTRVNKVVVPMGVGSHFLYWGYKPEQIIELNWYQSIMLSGGIKITATPARHQSGRTFGENKTLCASFVINADGSNMFYSGDGGYGPHFKQIGQRFGPFDLAFMECGQYSPNWLFLHMLPSQTAQAGLDLQAKMIQPIHWAKFAESNHPWNEPVKLMLPRCKKTWISK